MLLSEKKKVKRNINAIEEKPTNLANEAKINIRKTPNGLLRLMHVFNVDQI